MPPKLSLHHYCCLNLSIRIGEKGQQVRNNTGVEHHLNASFKAAGEAAEGSSGLDEDFGAVVGSGGENRDDGQAFSLEWASVSTSVELSNASKPSDRTSCFLIKSQPKRPSTCVFQLRSKHPHTLLPFGSGDNKIGPSTAISFPFENPAVADTGVRAFSFGIDNNTLRRRLRLLGLFLRRGGGHECRESKAA